MIVGVQVEVIYMIEVQIRELWTTSATRQKTNHRRSFSARGCCRNVSQRETNEVGWAEERNTGSLDPGHTFGALEAEICEMRHL